MLEERCCHSNMRLKSLLGQLRYFGGAMRGMLVAHLGYKAAGFWTDMLK